MNGSIEEQLSKSRTTYRNLHHPPSPIISPTRKKHLPSEESDDDDDSTLPTFVNRFFFPKNPQLNSSPLTNDTGMFRAIRGQVIIHHDHDRSSKVQCEENDEDEEELENLPINRLNGGNYELHYDVDNPLEISCSMSLSSAETVSDHSPSPIRHTSSINIDGNTPNSRKDHTPIEPSSSTDGDDDDDDDDDDETASSISSEEKKPIDCDNIKEQDEKLRTFRGWHLSMLKQIDEKLREIELETTPTPVPPPTTPVISNKKSFIKPLTNKKKFLRPTIRRRFEAANSKRSSSPIPQIKLNPFRSRTPSVEKESRTLIINLPPSSSSSSSDNEQDFPPPPPAPSEPIHIRIVQSPIYPVRQRSQSTERLILRDQGAQTEPLDNSNDFIHQRPARPASVECDRIQPSRSLTRTQTNHFLRQQQEQAQRPTEQIKFYSLRTRNIQPRPAIVTQAPTPKPPPVVYNQSMPSEKKTPPPSSNFQSTVSADPSVYSDDYGHVTQMDTRNLGSLVDKVFDDIYQDKPSDFYRDYRQLLNDIQIRFSMISSVEQSSTIQGPPQPPPPPPPPVYRQPKPSQPIFMDYSRIPQTPPSQARLCDTLIYIPNAH